MANCVSFPSWPKGTFFYSLEEHPFSTYQYLIYVARRDENASIPWKLYVLLYRDKNNNTLPLCRYAVMQISAIFLADEGSVFLSALFRFSIFFSAFFLCAQAMYSYRHDNIANHKPLTVLFLRAAAGCKGSWHNGRLLSFSQNISIAVPIY